MEAAFCAATESVIGDGRSTAFWTDRWVPNACAVRDVAPNLLPAVGARRRRLVADAVPGNTWVRDITGPLSSIAVMDYFHLWDIVQGTQLTDTTDRLLWKWDVSSTYSASSAYKALFMGAARPLGAKELWKVSAPPRVKHSFWIAMHKRSWTAARRYRHGLQDSSACILCGVQDEEIDHVLLSCAFSASVWVAALGVVGMAAAYAPPTSFWEWWISARKQVPKGARRGFDSLILLMGWVLWKERNARTFDVVLVDVAMDEAKLWYAAGFRQIGKLLPFVGSAPVSHNSTAM